MPLCDNKFLLVYDCGCFFYSSYDIADVAAWYVSVEAFLQQCPGFRVTQLIGDGNDSYSLQILG